jgi:uncharacterized protein (DUF1684 family)
LEAMAPCWVSQTSDPLQPTKTDWTADGDDRTKETCKYYGWTVLSPLAWVKAMSLCQSIPWWVAGEQVGTMEPAVMAALGQVAVARQALSPLRTSEVAG